MKSSTSEIVFSQSRSLLDLTLDQRSWYESLNMHFEIWPTLEASRNTSWCRICFGSDFCLAQCRSELKAETWEAEVSEFRLLFQGFETPFRESNRSKNIKFEWVVLQSYDLLANKKNSKNNIMYISKNKIYISYFSTQRIIFYFILFIFFNSKFFKNKLKILRRREAQPCFLVSNYLRNFLWKATLINLRFSSPSREKEESKRGRN